MKSTPLLFKPEMIRACLDGRKRMTRRLVKPQPAPDATSMPEKFPYGRVGDEIWGREAYQTLGHGRGFGVEISYMADGLDPMVNRSYGKNRINADCPDHDDRWRPIRWGKWKPSIHQPRWASRFVRTLTRVRVVKLQSITEVDAELEGVTPNTNERELATEAFARLWDSINRDYAPWESNPWVWVLEW